MTISIELPPEIKQRFDSLVSKTGRSIDFYLLESIERGLDDTEDYHLAITVHNRVLQGTEKVHSEAQVRESLGLDD